MVSSKFDNRLKEFTERWEVDRYLSATGYLPGNVRPFFVALPKDRSIAGSVEFRAEIQEVRFPLPFTPKDLLWMQGFPLPKIWFLTHHGLAMSLLIVEITGTLHSSSLGFLQVDNKVLNYLRKDISGGFDEEQYGERVGFGNLRK